MTHHATEDFWECYSALPEMVRQQADKSFELLKRDQQHPSLHFKKIGSFYSVRVGLSFRALAVKDGERMVWFWVGSHADYDKLI